MTIFNYSTADTQIAQARNGTEKYIALGHMHVCVRMPYEY